MSDIDNFLMRELKVKGPIVNQVHHFTYFEIKRLIIQYHIEQTGNNTTALHKRQDKLPDQDQGPERDGG